MQAKKSAPPAELPAPKVSSKQKYSSEDIFKYVNFAVTTILAFCVKGFLDFRALCEKKGYYVFSVDSLIWVAVGFGFFCVWFWLW